jgi:acylphosphatase
MFHAFTGTISGRVQGVGFRYFAKNKAIALHLSGWVRNLPDGTVEVLACGERRALEQFMQSLEEGPIGSRVEDTQIQWLQQQQNDKKFEILG